MAKETPTEITLKIVLAAPPPGVDFGVQDGKGNNYRTLQKQRSKGGDLHFACTVTVKNGREDGAPNLLGSVVQGPPAARFIYIGVGKYAGQIDSCWERRIKVPLAGITWDLIERAAAGSSAGHHAR